MTLEEREMLQEFTWRFKKEDGLDYNNGTKSIAVVKLLKEIDILKAKVKELEKGEE